MLDAIIVGQVIQRVREEKRMSQELVSGLAGIGRTHLSAIERGEHTFSNSPCRWMTFDEPARSCRSSTFCVTTVTSKRCSKSARP